MYGKASFKNFSVTSLKFNDTFEGKCCVKPRRQESGYLKINIFAFLSKIISLKTFIGV